jgi:protein-S-isoprenylcysteine O-methyltransferase Ste14
MHDGSDGLIGALWILWALYWLAAARGVKAVREREGRRSRLAFVITMLIVAALLAHRWPGWLGLRIVPGGWVRYWSAVTLIAAGLGFSVWARRVLGGNWSGTVTLKVGHELIVRGPYRWVRHPIYSGLLLALLGSALAPGEVRGFLAFLIALMAIWGKSRLEESFMERQFGERYIAYRRSSWALVPGLL